MRKFFKSVALLGGVLCVSILTVLYTKKEEPLEGAPVFMRRALPTKINNGTLASCPPFYMPELSTRLKLLHNLSMSRSVRLKISPKKIYTESVVIMTPISNAEDQLTGYFRNLCRLTYPHSLLSIALIEDSSRDNTGKEALRALQALQKHFAKVSMYKSKDYLSYRDPSFRHEIGWQLTRRSHLAKSRNFLLSRGLANETWVLWMDSDVRYIPADLIQQLLAAAKDIVVPSCMFLSDKRVDVYDKNTWKETDTAKQFLKGKGNEFLMLEGYGPPMRSYLNKLKDKGNIVEIDGVGGCVLLVRADLHRKGLVFPPYIYKNHIETEGLAKMAQDMGLKIYGLPNFEVYHE